jgi:hypothetical protein
MWSLAALAAGGWLGGQIMAQHWPVTWFGFGGGLLFGIGAAINGGCVFSSLSRLADGESGMLAAVAMWPAGALLEMALIPGASGQPRASTSLPHLLHPALAMALLAWIAWEMWRLIAGLKAADTRNLLASPRLRLSGAAALIGISNGLIYLHFQSWSFTSTVVRGIAGPAAGGAAGNPAVWLLLVAAFGGMLFSAVSRGTFRLRPPRRRALTHHATGGLAMGFAAAMIPGGNDALILYGMPLLSPHAIPAIAGILLGIALVFTVMKVRGGTVPQVVCRGDVCLTP